MEMSTSASLLRGLVVVVACSLIAAVSATSKPLGAPTNLTLAIDKVDVHSVVISWTAGNPKAVQSYEVHHTDGSAEVRVRGDGVLSAGTTVHLPESAHRYNVCVAAILVDASLPPVVDCAEVRTLELVRADSLLAVLLVIGFVISLVALAYAAWRYRAYKQAHERGYKPSAGDKAEAAYLTAHDRDSGA